MGGKNPGASQKITEDAQEANHETLGSTMLPPSHRQRLSRPFFFMTVKLDEQSQYVTTRVVPPIEKVLGSGVQGERGPLTLKWSCAENKFNEHTAMSHLVVEYWDEERRSSLLSKFNKKKEKEISDRFTKSYPHPTIPKMSVYETHICSDVFFFVEAKNEVDLRKVRQIRGICKKIDS